MRVIVTSPTWTLNGVNAFAATLVRRLGAEGHDITVLLTGSMWRDVKPLPVPEDLRIEQLALPSLATWPARWEALRQHLERAAPCLYLPNHDIWHAGIAPVLSSRVGIIGIAHSDDPQHYAQARRLAPWWNAAVGVSVVVAERLSTFPELTGTRVVHIPYGVDIADKVTDVPQRDPDAPLRIMYAGRLEQHQKRVGDLIAIAAVLRAHAVAFTLAIVGDGVERATLERRVQEQGLTGVIRFVGTVALDEMSKIFRAHDVFLLPSAFEGLPLAMLQAMGEGVVPIVSDVESGVPQLIVHGASGFRVAIGDIDGFAFRLATLAGDRVMCRTMGAAARDAVRTGLYGADVMTARYESLFGEVWDDIISARYARPYGAIIPPPALDWRANLRATLTGFGGRARRGA
jgi:glycosyltransferase involved in cell wall biosynthesis